MENQSTTFSMRLSKKEKKELISKAKQNGFSSLAVYLKYVGLNAALSITVKD